MEPADYGFAARPARPATASACPGAGAGAEVVRVSPRFKITGHPPACPGTQAAESGSSGSVQLGCPLSPDKPPGMTRSRLTTPANHRGLCLPCNAPIPPPPLTCPRPS